MERDNDEWIAQVRRRCDAFKIAITSNGRLSESALADLASRAESLFKEARALVKEPTQ